MFFALGCDMLHMPYFNLSLCFVDAVVEFDFVLLFLYNCSAYQVVKVKSPVSGVVDTHPQLTIKGIGLATMIIF